MGISFYSVYIINKSPLPYESYKPKVLDKAREAGNTHSVTRLGLHLRPNFQSRVKSLPGYTTSEVPIMTGHVGIPKGTFQFYSGTSHLSNEAVTSYSC